MKTFDITPQLVASMTSDSSDVSQVSWVTNDVLKAKAFIVDEAQFKKAGDDVGQAFHFVRSHTNPLVYLKPLVLICKKQHANKFLHDQADTVVYSGDALASPDTSAKILKVWQWIKSLPNTDESSSDTNMSFKALRLIASRQTQLTPLMTREHAAGFVYPLIQPLFAKQDFGVFNILAFLDQQNLISGTFHERIHQCSFCSSAFLNFTENCPDCGSSHLARNELVHHFKCGHVAPLKDFRNGVQLQCPKCDQLLRHIGVDYDKPSLSYECNDCSLSFQTPTVNTRCFECERQSSVDDTVQTDIKKYDITTIGANAAFYGLDALFTNILRTELDLHSVDEFKAFFKIENARITRYKRSSSTIATIHLKALPEIYQHLGKKTQQLFRELSAVFKSIFRESDVITALNESVFLVIMTETSTENASTALKRLEVSLHNLLSSVSKDIADSMITDIIAVDECKDVDALIANVLEG